MSVIEAMTFYASIGRIFYDSTSDPLDFLQTIELRTRTVHTEHQRMLIVELSIEGAILDWFIQVIQPHMTTLT